jgi:hypothetical protein
MRKLEPMFDGLELSHVLHRDKKGADTLTQMGSTRAKVINDDTEEDTRLEKKLLARKVSSIDTFVKRPCHGRICWSPLSMTTIKGTIHT